MAQGEDADLPSGDARPDVVTASANTSARDDATRAVNTEKRRPKGGPPLTELTRNRLATQLRAMYDNVAQQPVPDRFAELIAQLDSGETKKV